MKRANILKVYRRDLKNSFTNPIAFIIILAICVIPSLYAWINIAACWDVYENTGFIPVAVVNNDNTVGFNSAFLNIGDDVVDALKENDKIKWTFVSRDEADLGLMEGRYYASIEIPSSFTDDFLSILTKTPRKPRIIYKVDNKSNPVAVKITDSAKNTLVEQIKSNFIATVNETIFKSLNTVGEDADAQKGDLLKFKDTIVEINRNADMIEDGLNNLHNGSETYKTFMDNMGSLMPSIDANIETLEKSLDTREDILKRTQLVVNTGIDSLESVFERVLQSNKQIEGIMSSLSNAESQLSAKEIDKLTFDSVIELQSLNRSISSTIDYLKAVQKINYNSRIESTLEILENIKKTLGALENQVENIKKQLAENSGVIDEAFKTQIAGLELLTKNLTEQLDKVIGQLEAINDVFDSPALKQVIDNLKNIPSAEALINKLSESEENLIEAVETVGASLSEVVKTLDSSVNDATVFLNGVRGSQKSRNASISEIINDLRSIQTYLQAEQSEIVNLKDNFQNSAVITANIRSQVIESVEKTSTGIISIQQRSLKELKNDLNSILAESIVTAEQSRVHFKSLKELSNLLQTSMTLSADGGQLTADLSMELSSMLEDTKSVVSLLGERFEMADNRDINLIITLLESNPEFMGDFMSNPFDLKTEIINAVPNYGSSMAPIYSTLALWVGCLILNSVLKSHPGDFKGSKHLSIREKHFGKLMYFCTLAMIQGLIVAVGDIWFLKIYVVDIPLFILFAILSSLIFATITFTLMATLSNLGKALAIVYMILQIAGSGGTYPIQVDPLIFRIMQPLFPFTYTVNGFREAVAGPLAVNVILNIIALITFGIVFIVYGYLTIEKLYPRVIGFEKKLKESGISE